jgi:hypothetical protein
MGSYYQRDYDKTDRQRMDEHSRKAFREDALRAQVGKICPECQRRLVGYTGQKGNFGIYCLLRIGSFDDRNRPGFKTRRALLGFSSHQMTQDGKPGFWTDAARVDFGPDGAPQDTPRDDRRGPAAPPVQPPGEAPLADEGLPF